jgi:hypothetical protein
VSLETAVLPIHKLPLPWHIANEPIQLETVDLWSVAALVSSSVD